MGLWRGLLYVDLLALAAGIAVALLAAVSWRLSGGAKARVATPTFELVNRRPRSRWLIALVPAVMAISTVLAFAAQPAEVGTAKMFLLFPLAAAVVSVLVVTWTEGTRFDADTRRVSQWRGARVGARTFAFVERAHQIGADDCVVFAERFRSTGKQGGYYVFELSLDKLGHILEDRDADIVRLFAERIAKTFGLDIVDHTSADNVALTRRHADLDMPLADQLRARGKTETRAPLPERTRLILESDDLPWVVRVPPKYLRASDIGVLVIATLIIFMIAMVPALILLAIAVDRVGSSVLALAALIGIPIHWFTITRVILRARRETQLVQLSPSGIRVLRRSPGFSTANELPAERIEEIVIAHNREQYGTGLVVVVRGDGVSLELGHGVDRADADWLRHAAIAALAPPSLYR